MDHSRPADAPMTLEQALSWIASTLNEPPDRVHAGARRTDLPTWDSLGQLLLLAALDQQFGIKLSTKQVATLDSVEKILEILRRHDRLA